MQHIESPPPSAASHHNGFTLVELAIVLVIIGLIIGGILVGAELIASAKRNRAIAEIQRLVSAVNTFQAKYDCIPGDCANATTWFSSAANGNGNGLVSDANGGNLNEVWQLYLELSLAKLIEGTFTGAAGPNGAFHCSPGVNVLASKAFTNVGYTYLNYGAAGNSGADFTTPVMANYVGNVIFMGQPKTSGGVPTLETMQGAITPTDAYVIDTKLDDGAPATGKIVIPFPSYSPACSTSTTNSIAAYNVTYAPPICALGFKQ